MSDVMDVLEDMMEEGYFSGEVEVVVRQEMEEESEVGEARRRAGVVVEKDIVPCIK